MPIKPKRDVIKSLTCRTRTIYGKERELWEAYFGSDSDGKKIRVSKSSKKDALLYIDEFYRKMREFGDSIMVLTPSQVYDAKTALVTLETAGAQITLTEAVRRLLESVASTGVIVNRTLSEAFDEYYDSIPEKQHHHRKAVKMRVGKWVQDFGADQPCSDVTAKKVAEYLSSGKKISDKTFNNRLSYIKSFLQWCTKKERLYLPINPAEDMDTRKIAYKEPEYMPVDDFETMIRHFESVKDRKALSVIVLSFFCGIRSDEVERIMKDPKQLNLEEETIRIAMPKGWTQGMAPRSLQIPANALEWIHKYKLQGVLGEFNVKNMRAYVYKTAREMEIKVPANVARHTFITMHIAAYGEPAKTEAMAGTSKEMRSAHYMGLASERDGKRFFGILPKENEVVR